MKTIMLFSLFLTVLGIYVYCHTPQPTIQREIILETFEPYDMTIEAWELRKGKK